MGILLSLISVIIFAIIMGFYVIVPIASVGLIIWAIRNRIEEKKREEIEHKDYKNY